MASANHPITKPLTKSELIAHIAENTDVASKDIRTVIAALEDAIANSVHKNGAGSFTLPGFFKIDVVQVAAKPAHEGINPFTKEKQTFPAKPASVKVKIRPLKKLKDAAQ